jgi:hypothetical protein
MKKKTMHILERKKSVRQRPFCCSWRKTSANYRSIFWPAGDGGGGAAYTPSSAAAISSKEFPGFFSMRMALAHKLHFPAAYFILERKK